MPSETESPLTLDGICSQMLRDVFHSEELADASMPLNEIAGRVGSASLTMIAFHAKRDYQVILHSKGKFQALEKLVNEKRGTENVSVSCEIMAHVLTLRDIAQLILEEKSPKNTDTTTARIVDAPQEAVTQ